MGVAIFHTSSPALPRQEETGRYGNTGLNLYSRETGVRWQARPYGTVLDVHKDKSESDPIDKVSTLTEHRPLKGPKSLNFQGPHPFQWPSKWICPHQFNYVPRHINNRFNHSYTKLENYMGAGILGQQESRDHIVNQQGTRRTPSNLAATPINVISPIYFHLG